MRKLPARKLLLALAAGALLVPYEGFTLGLGEIEVNSALNQKLKADIELLSATPEDTENLIVKLASRKEFIRAGLDRPFQLSDLRFKSEVVNGVPYIKVSSGSPIREPFLNFLVEVDWPNGHLLREYTVLLDPPAFMMQSAGTTSAPAQPGTTTSSSFRPTAGSSTSAAPVVSQQAAVSSRPTAAPVTPEPAQAPAPAEPVSPPSSWTPAPAPVQPQPQPVMKQAAGDYQIKRGDTAWSLADAMRPDQSITIPQMMIAMLRANPESFIDGNINGLKRGHILRVPDYDQISAVKKADALAIVKEQAALWQQYQQSQSDGEPVSAMATDNAAPSATAADSETASADEGAYLEIVSAGSGTSTMSGKDPTKMTAAELRAELALAREKVETERVEKEALQQRVDTLEQSVDKMQGMLAIEDEELSAVQSLNQPAAEDAAAETAAVEGETISEAALEEADAAATEEVADEAADETAAATEDMAEDMAAGEAAEEAAADDVAEGMEEEAVFADETVTGDEAVAEMPAEVEPQAMDESAAEQPQIASRAPTDPLSKLLNDPTMLVAAGGGLLLFLILIVMIIKRRNSAADDDAPAMASAFDDLDSLAAEVADEKAAMSRVATGSAAKVSPSVNKAAESEYDAAATTVLDSAEGSAATESAAAKDDEPRDDVIAEADVYLAYGIYQQAEELLNQAIADNPNRDDYRLKLAETHYASKDAEKFVAVSSAMKKRLDDNSPLWQKVMVMGQDLCADNPMFQGSMAADVDVASLSPDTPAMDFDLGTDETESSSEAADLGLSLDDSPLELPEADAQEETRDAISAEAVDELEFDLNEAAAVDETVVADAAEEFSLDIDASELDIDTQDDTAKAVEDDEVSIELDEIDIGLDDDSANEAEVESEIAVAASADAGEAEDDFDLSSLDDVDEISTKLDLARAYLDMGDQEGTRGILEEVIAEGNDEQKQEASALMKKIA